MHGNEFYNVEQEEVKATEIKMTRQPLICMDFLITLIR